MASLTERSRTDRGFWTRETGTGRQVAQPHERLMMMMMMMMMIEKDYL
jgi:hypothetical protein